jgi:hypothetical protein
MQNSLLFAILPVLEDNFFNRLNRLLNGHAKKSPVSFLGQLSRHFDGVLGDVVLLDADVLFGVIEGDVWPFAALRVEEGGHLLIDRDR